MLGYKKKKDLFPLPSDTVLFGICHKEWDNRGRTDITLKASKCIHKQNWIHTLAQLGAIRTQPILVPLTFVTCPFLD